MASTQEVDKMRNQAAREILPHDPDSAAAQDVAWRDLTDGLIGFLVGLFRASNGGTGNVSQFSIIANSAADGTGTDVTIKTKDLTGIVPDAEGDFVWLEVSAEEIAAQCRAAGVTPKGISANVTLDTSTDELVVYYERLLGIKQADNTADTVA